MPVDHPRASRGGVFALALLWAWISGCSLLLDLGAVQCQSDADCARFPRSRCDLRSHLCAADAALSSTGGTGADAGPTTPEPLQCQSASGCAPCATGALPGFQNACAGGGCVPFDNPTRLGKSAPDGGLRPLR